MSGDKSKKRPFDSTDDTTVPAAVALMGTAICDLNLALRNTPVVPGVNNPAHDSHQPVNRVTPTDLKYLEYVGTLFSVFGITQAIENLDHYIYSDKLSPSERFFGILFASGQLFVSSLLFIGFLGMLGVAAAPVATHILPLALLVYGLAMAAKHLFLAAKSLWDGEYKQAMKHFVQAVLSALMVTVLIKLFSPIMERAKAFLSSVHSGNIAKIFQSLTNLGNSFKSGMEWLLATTFVASVTFFVANRARAAWELASNPALEMQDAWSHAKAAYAKASQVDNAALRKLAQAATVLIQALRLAGKAIKTAVAVLLTLGLAAAFRARKNTKLLTDSGLPPSSPAATTGPGSAASSKESSPKPDGLRGSPATLFNAKSGAAVADGAAADPQAPAASLV